MNNKTGIEAVEKLKEQVRALEAQQVFMDTFYNNREELGAVLIEYKDVLNSFYPYRLIGGR